MVTRYGYTIGAWRHRFIPYNGKIADITEADTNRHTLDLATALSETRKIIAIIIGAVRLSGSGDFKTYPNEGTDRTYDMLYGQIFVWTIIADGTNRLQYSQSVANDDWEIYCGGYVVED